MYLRKKKNTVKNYISKHVFMKPERNRNKNKKRQQKNNTIKLILQSICS